MIGLYIQFVGHGFVLTAEKISMHHGGSCQCKPFYSYDSREINIV